MTVRDMADRVESMVLAEQQVTATPLHSIVHILTLIQIPAVKELVYYLVAATLRVIPSLQNQDLAVAAEVEDHTEATAALIYIYLAEVEVEVLVYQDKVRMDVPVIGIFVVPQDTI